MRWTAGEEFVDGAVAVGAELLIDFGEGGDEDVVEFDFEEFLTVGILVTLWPTLESALTVRAATAVSIFQRASVIFEEGVEPGQGCRSLDAFDDFEEGDGGGSGGRPEPLRRPMRMASAPPPVEEAERRTRSSSCSRAARGGRRLGLRILVQGAGDWGRVAKGARSRSVCFRSMIVLLNGCEVTRTNEPHRGHGGRVSCECDVVNNWNCWRKV